MSTCAGGSRSCRSWRPGVGRRPDHATLLVTASWQASPPGASGAAPGRGSAARPRPASGAFESVARAPAVVDSPAALPARHARRGARRAPGRSADRSRPYGPGAQSWRAFPRDARELAELPVPAARRAPGSRSESRGRPRAPVWGGRREPSSRSVPYCVRRQIQGGFNPLSSSLSHTVRFESDWEIDCSDLTR